MNGRLPKSARRQSRGGFQLGGATVLAVVAAVWCPRALGQQATVPAGALNQIASFDFRGLEVPRGLRLIGEQAARVEATPQGLHVVVAPGAGRAVVAGVAYQTPLPGDFALTCQFRLERADQPQIGAGAGFRLHLSFAEAGAPFAAEAMLGHVVRSDGAYYWLLGLIDRSNPREYRASQAIAVDSSDGQMRIERRGDALRLAARRADDEDWRPVGDLPCPRLPVCEIRAAMENGNSNAGVEGYLVQIAIRAAAALPVSDAVLETLDGRTIPAAPLAIENGEVVVGVDPPGRFALDELRQIRLVGAASEQAGPGAVAPAAGAVPAQPTAGDPENPFGEARPAAADAERESTTGEDPIPAAEIDAAAAKRVILHQRGSDMLSGTLDSWDRSHLAIRTDWGERWSLPLDALRGMRIGALSGAELARFHDRLERPESSDLVFVRARDGSLSTVAGLVEGLRDEMLRLEFDGASRGIALPRVAGVVLAAHTVPQHFGGDCYQRLLVGADQAIAGRCVGLTNEAIELESPWGDRWHVPRERVSVIEVHNGRLVYLSDREPLHVEQAGYFGEARAYRRDCALDGGPLEVAGQRFSKGLATPSRTVLIYDLGGQFERFEALLGFDPAAGDRGRVACRVLADDHVVGQWPDLRASDPPVALSLPMTGVKRLTLEVDFGADEDLGDRVHWAAARVLRARPTGS